MFLMANDYILITFTSLSPFSIYKYHLSVWERHNNRDNKH